MKTRAMPAPPLPPCCARPRLRGAASSSKAGLQAQQQQQQQEAVASADFAQSDVHLFNLYYHETALGPRI